MRVFNRQGRQNSKSCTEFPYFAKKTNVRTGYCDSLHRLELEKINSRRRNVFVLFVSLERQTHKMDALAKEYL